MAITAAPPPSGPMDLSGDPRRHRRERTMGLLFLLAAALSVVVSAAIVMSLFGKGWDFIADADWGGVIGDATWNPRQGAFGVRPLLMSSLIVTGIAMLVAVPLGLGAAIYLSEYARPRVRAWLKPILEVLAGVPSVVLGFFALGWIAPNVIGTLFGEEHGRSGSMAAAGIGVGILTIPLVASVSEDAMRAVPPALREASYGLGAKRLTTSLRVVVPAAISGIVAAMILAISRAVGETMVVAVAAGATGGSLFTLDPLGPGQTLTAAMASLATGSDNVVGDDAAFLSLFFLGLVLFVM